MKIGFTGTRQGLTPTQERQLRVFLAEHHYIEEWHHGDCIGADQQATAIARAHGIRIVGHPPNNDKHRAYTKSDLWLPTQSYMQRNRAIVNACDSLLAAPRTLHEEVRSGTWSTVRYARKIGIPILILSP